MTRLRDHWEIDRRLDRNREREPRQRRLHSRLIQQARFADILSGVDVDDENGGES